MFTVYKSLIEILQWQAKAERLRKLNDSTPMDLMLPLEVALVGWTQWHAFKSKKCSDWLGDKFSIPQRHLAEMYESAFDWCNHVDWMPCLEDEWRILRFLLFLFCHVFCHHGLHLMFGVFLAVLQGMYISLFLTAHVVLGLFFPIILVFFFVTWVGVLFFLALKPLLSPLINRILEWAYRKYYSISLKLTLASNDTATVQCTAMVVHQWPIFGKSMSENFSFKEINVAGFCRHDEEAWS